MDKKNSHAYVGLKKIPELLDLEILVSRTGIGESDSTFIWASTFMAPESIVMLDGQMFLNLFLPEGSETDQEKKIFLNRVDAKLLDGLWQVRRRMDQLKGDYGGPLQFTLSTFRTAVVDQAYIRNGRAYVRLLMNSCDFDLYSRLMLRGIRERKDLKIEYFRKSEGKNTNYLIPGLEEDLCFVTMKFGTGNQISPSYEEDDQFFFIMANFVEGGVKTIGRTKSGSVPQILLPEEVSNPAENVYTFKTNNKFVLSLMRQIAYQYALIFGFYGTISKDSASLTAAIPKEQVQFFLKILASVSEENGDCTPLVTEIMSIKDFQE